MPQIVADNTSSRQIPPSLLGPLTLAFSLQGRNSPFDLYAAELSPATGDQTCLYLLPLNPNQGSGQDALQVYVNAKPEKVFTALNTARAHGRLAYVAIPPPAGNHHRTVPGLGKVPSTAPSIGEMFRQTSQQSCSRLVLELKEIQAHPSYYNLVHAYGVVPNLGDDVRPIDGVLDLSTAPPEIYHRHLRNRQELPDPSRPIFIEDEGNSLPPLDLHAQEGPSPAATASAVSVFAEAAQPTASDPAPSVVMKHALPRSTSIVDASLTGTLNDVAAETAHIQTRPLNSAAQQRLLDAIEAGDFEGAYHAVDCGATVNPESNWPLERAARLGHTEMIRFFSLCGADIHAHDEAALHIAASLGHTDAVRTLLELGADKTVRNYDRDGETVEYAALSHGHTETAALISSWTANVSPVALRNVSR